MRKFMMIVAAATVFFCGSGVAHAGDSCMIVDSLKVGNTSEQAVRGIVGNLLGSIAKSSTSKENATDTLSKGSGNFKMGSGKLGNLGKTSALGDVLGSLIDGAVEGSKPVAERVIGTWGYQGSKCVLESDDVMKRMGGELMTTPIENKMNTTLDKIGVRKGAFSFTFNNDGTFSSKTSVRTVSGKYIVDEANKKVTLTYMGGLVKTTMDVLMINHKLSLLYDADKILLFLNAVCAKSNSSTLKTFNKITEAYEGMKIGLEFAK